MSTSTQIPFALATKKYWIEKYWEDMCGTSAQAFEKFDKAIRPFLAFLASHLPSENNPSCSCNTIPSEPFLAGLQTLGYNIQFIRVPSMLADTVQFDGYIGTRKIVDIRFVAHRFWHMLSPLFAWTQETTIFDADSPYGYFDLLEFDYCTTHIAC